MKSSLLHLVAVTAAVVCVAACGSQTQGATATTIEEIVGMDAHRHPFCVESDAVAPVFLDNGDAFDEAMLRSALDRIDAVAPEAIAADVDVWYTMMVSVLEGADSSEYHQRVGDLSGDPLWEEAHANIGAWYQTNCVENNDLGGSLLTSPDPNDGTEPVMGSDEPADTGRN